MLANSEDEEVRSVCARGTGVACDLRELRICPDGVETRIDGEQGKLGLAVRVGIGQQCNRFLLIAKRDRQESLSILAQWRVGRSKIGCIGDGFRQGTLSAIRIHLSDPRAQK